MPQPQRLIVTWTDLEQLVEVLAEKICGDAPASASATTDPVARMDPAVAFDVMLAITRGALVPAGMLAYRLGMRNIVVAAVAFYDDEGHPAEHPTFLQFPSDPLLHGKRVLIVDEVWDTGTTIQAVIDRVRLAGGQPTTAVLHYKPAHSRVPAVPDHYAVETDAWVVYPFKWGR